MKLAKIIDRIDVLPELPGPNKRTFLCDAVDIRYPNLGLLEYFSTRSSDRNLKMPKKGVKLTFYYNQLINF